MSQTDGVDTEMKKIIMLGILTALITIHCGPPPKVTISPEQTDCAPRNLIVKPNSNSLFMQWDTPCPDNINVAGYNIYVLPSPIGEKYPGVTLSKKVVPFNSGAYPGDTDPEDRYETFSVQNLDNGVEYYVSVRTMFTDGSLSFPTKEHSVICRPEGTFELAYRYADERDGFSFGRGDAVRADSDFNDLYFYHKDGVDYLASPSRLNGFIRTSKFYSLGKTSSVYQYPELDLDIPPVDRMPVRVGESYLIKTADGNYAKVRIESASGERKERKLNISYIYQTIPDLMRF